MLRAPARVWPALMEQRHRLAAPWNYSRKPWRGVAKATVRGTVARAQRVLMRRKKSEARSWGTGREWGKWSQCETVEPLL